MPCDVVGIGAAIASAIAAFATAGFAWWQDQLQKKLIKQGLYEKRLAVFLATMRFLSEIALKPEIEFDQPIQLLRETLEAEFLFGPEIETFIKQVSAKASELRTKSKIYPQANTPEQRRQELMTECNALENWLVEDAFGLAKTHFAKYLRLD
jgi:hypothetical protein